MTEGREYLGKVKTEHIKRLGQELMSRFPEKFSSNFDDNKRAVDALTEGATTKVRNQVAGYITHTISLTQDDSLGENVEEELSV
jgi:small subunit ribosomal protein S17e